jgi:two-component system cell cycle response regulator DivK
MLGSFSVEVRRTAFCFACDVAPERKLLVLLVDDDGDTREMYSAYLRYSGLQVDEASSAYCALERAHEKKPDVIVTDVAMPGMDGLELSRKLRQEIPTRDVPIIAVSGQPTESLRQTTCDVVLQKPCRPDRLLRAIEDVLDKPHRE